MSGCCREAVEHCRLSSRRCRKMFLGCRMIVSVISSDEVMVGTL
ncbi:MAG: hypothetical protein ACTSPW_19495 [Promethearchaeota archaeon]